MSESNTLNSSASRENASASSLEDEKLVRIALSGDESGFKGLLLKYEKPLYFHIKKMIREHEQIEDLVQEVFAKVYRNLSSYSTDYAFSTWIYRIATNHSIDYLRKRKLQTLSIDEPYDSEDGELKIQLPDEDAETDRKIIRKERKLIIHEAIDALPEKYRVVIRLRHMEELSYDEIAEELNLPLGTIKAHIFRARELLYKALIDKRDRF